MGLQRVGHNWATEVKWTEHIYKKLVCIEYSKELDIFSMQNDIYFHD